MTKMLSPITPRRALPIVVALAALLVLAASAHAQPRVAVTGATTVGTKLTAKVTGGKGRGITWQACSVKPNGRTCPTASLTRLGTKRTYTLTDTTTGAYIRAQAKVRPKKGKTRTVTSPWRGPITTPDNGGGGGGEGGARVGSYYCRQAGAINTYVAILDGGRYLGPYYLSASESPSGRYRLKDGPTKFPGGKVFEYLDGPYAGPEWRNEYYPNGYTTPSGTTYDKPQILVIVAETGDWQDCEWYQADPR